MKNVSAGWDLGVGKEVEKQKAGYDKQLIHGCSR